jgi:hypothetical protein
MVCLGTYPPSKQYSSIKSIFVSNYYYYYYYGELASVSSSPSTFPIMPMVANAAMLLLAG